MGQFNSGRIQYGLAGIKLEMGVKVLKEYLPVKSSIIERAKE